MNRRVPKHVRVAERQRINRRRGILEELESSSDRRRCSTARTKSPSLILPRASPPPSNCTTRSRKCSRATSPRPLERFCAIAARRRPCCAPPTVVLRRGSSRLRERAAKYWALSKRVYKCRSLKIDHYRRIRGLFELDEAAKPAGFHLLELKTLGEFDHLFLKQALRSPRPYAQQTGCRGVRSFSDIDRAQRRVEGHLPNETCPSAVISGARSSRQAQGSDN